MIKNILPFVAPYRSPFSCVWVPTGDPARPLACVWVDRRLPAGTERHPRNCKYCA